MAEDSLLAPAAAGLARTAHLCSTRWWLEGFTQGWGPHPARQQGAGFPGGCSVSVHTAAVSVSARTAQSPTGSASRTWLFTPKIIPMKMAGSPRARFSATSPMARAEEPRVASVYRTGQRRATARASPQGADSPTPQSLEASRPGLGQPRRHFCILLAEALHKITDLRTENRL